MPDRQPLAPPNPKLPRYETTEERVAGFYARADAAIAGEEPVVDCCCASLVATFEADASRFTEALRRASYACRSFTLGFLIPDTPEVREAIEAAFAMARGEGRDA